MGDLELEAKRLTLAAELPEELALFINFEPSILGDPEWLERMTEVPAGADARRHLVAELTERAVLAAPGRLLAAVEACRSIGLRIALDDVGARSESLAASSELWATKRDLLDVSRHIESQALTSDTMILSSIQRSEFLSERTQRQYRALARRCGFVGLVGEGLCGVSGVSMEGVRVAEVQPGHPMVDSWHVVLLSPTISLAPDAPAMERRFRYRLVTDAVEVEAAANRLLAYF